MPIVEGQWRPHTSPKQDELRWLCHRDNPKKPKFVCVSGPRKSSKTFGCLNVVAEHLWETDKAQFGIIAPTVTSAADGGCWQLITETIIPQWIEGDFGFEWIREPYQEGISKKMKCAVSNKHGTKSVLQLETFRDGATEKEISARFKNKIFTGLYWSEVGTWVPTQTPFDIITDCFRAPHLKSRDHLMILDTNPEPPGEDHWIYQLFYKFRSADRALLEKMATEKGLNLELLLERQRNLGLMEFFVNDNPYLEEADLNELKIKYHHNQDLWDRYFLGKWTNASGDGLFADVFRPATHVVGELETPINPHPKILLPHPDTYELYTGWDPGVTNYATVIVEQVFLPDSKGKEVPHFNILDELVYIGEDISIGEFTSELMDKLAYWEHQLGRPIRWQHYADRSVFDMRESISDRRQHVEVYNASKGKIRLIAVEKGDGSVRQRIDILKKLLFQDRIQISKSKCPHTIESIQSLKKTKNRPIDKTSEHKHAFDALTYVLSTLCYEELYRESRSLVAKPKQSEYHQLQL